MSSAGGDRVRRGDDLPALSLTRLVVREAPPSPPPGPVRDRLAAQAAERVERAETAMIAAADAYTARLSGVVLARLRGPKARRGTRYWDDRTKGAAVAVETKAIDPEYVVPDSLIGEAVEAMRPVALRVAMDAAGDAAGRVVGDSASADGMFAINQDLLGDLIDEALEDLLGTAHRYATELRTTIQEGDRDGVPLDDLVGNVEEATERGGNWMRLSARTVGTALAGKAALEQARALGVTHVQWISRRDGRVRRTHVAADGQVRPVGEDFEVGAHRLEYPGDPSGLPGTAAEVHGCRCGLIFADPDDEFFDALDAIHQAVLADDEPPGLDALLDAAAASVVYAPGPDIPGMPDLAPLATAPHDVVGWRLLDGVLDVVPGQQVALPAGTVLGLAPPTELTPAALAVLIPAGTLIGVVGGALVLADATTVQVLAGGAGGVQGRLLGP